MISRLQRHPHPRHAAVFFSGPSYLGRERDLEKNEKPLLPTEGSKNQYSLQDSGTNHSWPTVDPALQVSTEKAATFLGHLPRPGGVIRKWSDVLDNSVWIVSVVWPENAPQVLSHLPKVGHPQAVASHSTWFTFVRPPYSGTWTP